MGFRRKMSIFAAAMGCLAATASAVAPAAEQDTVPSATTRLLSDVADGTNWPAYGRTFDEGHFSPLREINDQNVNRLGLAWAFDLPVTPSVVGAPLAVDGVLYFAVGFSVVRALDAATGKSLWSYDPDVPRVSGKKLSMAWGIRGIAYGDGKVYTGTQDGRLIALDARSGHLLWSVQTTQGPDDGRYITGAPRVFRDLVIIGHGGADTGDVRGYVTAYDARTGQERWRFYTVPGNPARGFENETMAMAAKTWTGEWWKYGGGGTVWNAITYDPELDRIYIGTGNGAPWNQGVRSPAGGDNLFLCSIVALDARTGRYIWHYQQVPGESWDFNAAADMSLATLMIDGRPRRVILQAPKNGFLYVIDRDSGKPISAVPFAKTSWADRIDPATWRPVEMPGVRSKDRGRVIFPGNIGAHTWHAQSFSPRTGLLYFPMHDVPTYYNPVGIDPKSWVRKPGWDTGYRPMGMTRGPEAVSSIPQVAYLLAWDSVSQTKRWSVPLPGVFNGGVASTAGNLVFQGNSGGKFVAYAADTGKQLWSFAAQNGIIGQPITYKANGRQYVTVIAGMGGAAGAVPSKEGWDYRQQKRRVLTFVLGGKAVLPPLEKVDEPIVDDLAFQTRSALVDAGNEIYIRRCVTCHGFEAKAGGATPDLRKSAVPLDRDTFTEVVRNGLFISQGMPGFSDMSNDDIEALRHYIRFEARAAKTALAP